MVTVVSTVPTMTVRVRVSIAVAVGIPVAAGRISVAVIAVASGVSLSLSFGRPLAKMTVVAVTVVRRVGSMAIESRTVTVISPMAVVDVSIVAVVAGIGSGIGVSICRPLVHGDWVGKDGSRTLRMHMTLL